MSYSVGYMKLNVPILSELKIGDSVGTSQMSGDIIKIVKNEIHLDTGGMIYYSNIEWIRKKVKYKIIDIIE